ncbi:MAG: autotransporter-associated beta strand repeat-containing protein, partial [bacterium]
MQINTTGTVANAMSIFNIRTMQTVTLSGNKTLNNATYTVDAGTTTTESGNLSGTGGITKQGTGTLIVTGNNSYTGAVAVDAGVLNL